MTNFKLSALLLSLIVAAPIACSAGAPKEPTEEDETGDGDGDGDGDINLGDGDMGDGDINVDEQPPTDGCGDSILDPDEACDDGNLESGDGCGGNCRYVEQGWVCPTAGEPCRQFSKCGDGVYVFPEQCDDGNLESGDGCSATCKVEIGSKCEGSPSICTPTTCGDSTPEGAETCDDGNSLPFDGCSAGCQGEPICTSDGCTSACGDGLIITPEQCDDGNAADGDGCSSTCQYEAGYECTQAARCPDGMEDCPLDLPIVFRDFTTAHPDFQVPDPQGTANADRPCDGYNPGIVAGTLSANNKPVFASAPAKSCTSEATFSQWYVESDVSATILGSIRLFPNGNGGYVNRFGENGELYQAYGQGRWCGGIDQYASCEEASAAGQCNTPAFNPATEVCFLPGDPGKPQGCPTDQNGMCAVPYTEVDGTPLFFPIDDHPDALPDTRYAARIPAQIYNGVGWPWEDPPLLHNFHFTSEIAYWFEYHDGMVADLIFIGDDDVFVFVNHRLVLDMGGIHVPLGGRFTLNAGAVTTRVWQAEDPGVADDAEVELASDLMSTADLGLVDGNVYEIKVFHAERKPEGSSFQLTLSGFNTARSECTAICGDGILASGEQCDNGAELNVGGHNGCNADCTLGSYCGDGIVQEEAEQCDDADPDPNAPAGCSGCRILVVR